MLNSHPIPTTSLLELPISANFGLRRQLWRIPLKYFRTISFFWGGSSLILSISSVPRRHPQLVSRSTSLGLSDILSNLVSSVPVSQGTCSLGKER